MYPSAKKILHGIFRNKGGGIGFEPPISLLRPSDSPTRVAQPFFKLVMKAHQAQVLPQQIALISQI
ncbi:hypothetical protein TTHERM_001119551 (macronuclear) [Tetrahymena thermophila SB210]|uniref:Uncharacterized protein n=1 Tax=Tetrahymena thermophila (strain SB210) TaxID=312017 RepID=W7XC84_TETTS|nr:hypothetical protein TTHERM_001119551 [Tetrahymena thermophila SB210]EWS75027.1 hypothetical protein TTHERM_001119551 [Tetrahymena thermophila SB210]|eukprot:XP_012652440.1 hypothetical protein TTHERM_001119551 [Tetrahymena thermophila SB210]